MPTPTPSLLVRSAAAMLAVAAAAPAQMAASFAERLLHWAWQPLVDATPPTVRDASWPADALDAFVLQKLEAAELRPAPDAPPEVWLRRVCFDLVGLPPSPAQLAAFPADPSPAAKARVVDELLASPQYGERWARHWLDVVRYAETLGHEFDFEVPNAWRYRDYVVRALNADVPFDQFAKEHVAGDLLPAPRLDPATGSDESRLATGFYWFCEQTHGPVDAKKHQADRIDNQIDVLSKAFLGVTVACARCHDHKFDAIRSRDYYALFGFLESSVYVQQPVFPTAPETVASAVTAHRALARLAATAAAADTPVDASLAAAARVGDAFGDAPWTGPFVTAVTDDAVTTTELPGSWWNSAAVDRSRDATLLTPTFALDAPYLHVEVAGKGARMQVVVDGLYLVRDPLYGKLHRAVDDDAPHWVTFDVGGWRGHPAHLQVLDLRAPDLADPDRDRGRYPDDAWIAVRQVRLTDDAAPPRREAGAGPVTRRVVTLTRKDPAVEAALQRWRDAVAALPDPATAPGMADGTGTDEHVFLRGNHMTPGELAPRRFLEALDGDAALPLPGGSGRLQLAERMFARANPLPARVLANRVWHHLFGRGLARSVDNLGHLGEPPSHPELLDRLAIDLAADGWSQKRLIRRIVLSRTYAMDSRGGDPAAAVRDADNVLLHRQNLRRLEGEPLRDAMLAFAGRLDLRREGPSVPLPLNDDDHARGRPATSGPIDGDGRRSLYLAVRRNFLPDLLVAFDLPTPFTTVGARSVANVPAQALTLLNDPFVRAVCQRAAERLLAERPDGDDDAAAVQRWFAAAFARSAAPAELQLCVEFLRQQRQDLQADASDPRPFAELAHALLARKEFLFLR